MNACFAEYEAAKAKMEKLNGKNASETPSPSSKAASATAKPNGQKPGSA